MTADETVTVLDSILYELRQCQRKGADPETAHPTADGLLILALNHLAEGHPEADTIHQIMKEWNEVEKWWA